MKKSLPLLRLALAAVSAAALTAATARADGTTDRNIENTANNSYNFRTVLDGKVHATCSDGVVTLTGTVRDADQKTLAEDTVNQIPDVRQVSDQIDVSGNGMTPRSDDWIEFKIKTALMFHANVSAAHTKVECHDGNVTLTGVATSDAQKELTEQIAHDIDGVRSVDNQIKVVPENNQPVPGYNRYSGNRENNDAIENTNDHSDVRDDGSITAQIKYELLTHKGTSALKTHVVTTDGVVQITGTADNQAEKDLVTRLAHDTAGVRGVQNDMQVEDQGQ